MEADLGEISVFISAVLLSLGGCFAVVWGAVKNSRCTHIKCCGCDLVRDVPPEELSEV